MRREPHPLTGTIYELVDDGIVRVQKQDSDSYGLFTWRGEWLEGDVKQADPTMLLYIGGPDLPEDHEVLWMSAPTAFHDGSIPVKAFPGTHFSELPRTVSKYVADTGLETAEGWRSIGYFDPQLYLANDRKPERIPEAYREFHPMPGGPKRVHTDRYWTKEFHDLEVEHIWKKTWQMACREDEIPEVGDYYVYEIAHLSFLVVRTEGGFKAHQNICLHRGRILKDCSGKGAKEFMCPFHGWIWNLDGSLKHITTEWDFPGVREDAAKLPEAKVATWQGYVFINPDPDAGSLDEFLGPTMMAHYEGFGFEHRYIQANVQKKIRCNWKVVAEAFMEAYHVIATHPHQMLTSSDLSNTHYDVFGNWGRAAQYPSPGSPQRGIFQTPEQALARYRASADSQVALVRALTGEDVSHYSDAELNSNGFHDLFPNLHPWGGWMRICFRFRPNGSNPEESIMDVLLLAPWPKDKPRPTPAKQRKLGFDDAWTSAPELLSLSKILDQDVFNVPAVQKGVRAKNPPYVWYSSFQEMKIRNFHRNYEKALGLEDDTPAEDQAAATAG